MMWLNIVVKHCGRSFFIFYRPHILPLVLYHLECVCARLKCSCVCVCVSVHLCACVHTNKTVPCELELESLWLSEIIIIIAATHTLFMVFLMTGMQM